MKKIIKKIKEKFENIKYRKLYKDSLKRIDDLVSRNMQLEHDYIELEHISLQDTQVEKMFRLELEIKSLREKLYCVRQSNLQLKKENEKLNKKLRRNK